MQCADTIDLEILEYNEVVNLDVLENGCEINLDITEQNDVVTTIIQDVGIKGDDGHILWSSTNW